MTASALPKTHTGSPGPDETQRRAADPNYSVWVGASAGSGKTTVLTSRLLRLLLPTLNGRPGTKPEAILCLTFTKTAAREMALRLNKRLALWAVADDAKLAEDMNRLLGRAPVEDEKAAARKLFAQVTDAPGGMKIMTIHSFCQSVLGRFPLEAGLTPPFSALDDAAAAALRQRARDDVLAQAGRVPNLDLGRALTSLAVATGEDAFDRLLQEIVKECRQLRDLPEDVYASVCAAIGVTAQSTDEILKVAVGDNVIDGESLRRACRALAEYGSEKTDQPKSVSIQNFLDAAHEKRIGGFESYCAQFITKDDEIRSKLMTAKVLDNFPEGDAALRAEAERLLAVRDHLKAAKAARLTADLMILGGAIGRRYDELKRARAALDFDDLINKTLDLLERSDMAGWVMYKLDGGLDHILIDEAQDTNPEQWRIVQALTGDFFSGLGTRPDVARTIFTVGDEKQSIYSFQRAAPEKFQEMRTYFADRVQAAKQKWRNEDMSFSFRSTPSVLRFVDEVFLTESVRKGLGLSKLLHASQRPKDAGTVEIWPLFATPEKEDRAPWSTPSAPRDSRSGGARLAEHIGATIRGWLDNKEQLLSQGRNVAPGDILILVRRRTAFVNQLIRALKTRNIPVSGVDRMVLKEQLAVQDLMAAAQFALLPEDDLILACLLKSPLIGWDDEKLEKIAPGRKGTLWDAVKMSSSSDIVAYLEALIRHGAADHPYEFFARLLQTPCPADTISGLHAMTARLGAEALDPLDEFLNIALAYESDNVAALQNFLIAIEQGDSEIKREQEEAGGSVRIMTVHGAKGLEAPIVILPDTTRTTANNKQRLIWPDKSGLKVPLWSPRADSDCTFYKTLLDSMEERQDEEYRRLLYVALTRAKDRLYIAGHTGRKAPMPDNWYNYATSAFDRLPDSESAPFDSPFFLKAEGVDSPPLRRISNAQTKPPQQKAAAQDNREAPLKAADLPWLFRAPEAEPDPPRPLAPSRPAEAEPAAQSPLAAADTYRFRRGTVTHRLLQLLPDLPQAQRADAAKRFADSYAADLPGDVRAGIATETLAILSNPEWAHLFGPDSLAEVPVTGMTNGRLVSGQIDRLVVTTKEILIVDYKTNRPPPKNEKDIPALYRAQMAAYSDIVARIYPGRAVRAFLLWTDGPALMELKP